MMRAKGQSTAMKDRFYFIVSILELIFGILAVASYIILAVRGEDMTPWTTALILAAALIIMGLWGIKNQRSK